MMEKTSVLIAAMRALVNELKTVRSLPEELQDEEQHLYQSDLDDALNALADQYDQHSERDASLTPFADLLRALEGETWPPRPTHRVD
ncbi:MULTISPECIES: hypothetical protein [unclassified Rhizobacter]|uniref:hypothetical protein n=1 Tax=unclassified Rhizobacter TaxID=2640088 RepID=UPI0006F34EA5|nr:MULTISPECIES: hypothetical protein [unclassified Rhizobacter]KQU75635.1 hypothetical protein ASC88_25065 [Rhizobacter sp. Root29]KQW07424.1 hypothetical protein ASC98_25390 [Rhizobacter sp. Root1238]